ncbi:MAG: hypothetical protein KAS72_07780 [Phycisphaerales bacterium]|nr:hypothetical protein [Phycisphaerales bacterium]
MNRTQRRNVTVRLSRQFPIEDLTPAEAGRIIMEIGPDRVQEMVLWERHDGMSGLGDMDGWWANLVSAGKTWAGKAASWASKNFPNLIKLKNAAGGGGGGGQTQPVYMQAQPAKDNSMMMLAIAGIAVVMLMRRRR